MGKEQTNASDYVKITAGILVIVVVFFFVANIFTPAGQKQAPSPTGAVAGVSTPSSAVEAVLKDGVQEVTLSWGKFNYNPEVISVKKDLPVRIKADLARLSGCFRSFQIPELGVSASFSESSDIIEFTPKKTGTFTFSCSMGMGSGKIIVA